VRPLLGPAEDDGAAGRERPGAEGEEDGLFLGHLGALWLRDGLED
jgi:hypothetical protein